MDIHEIHCIVYIVSCIICDAASDMLSAIAASLWSMRLGHDYSLWPDGPPALATLFFTNHLQKFKP